MLYCNGSRTFGADFDDDCLLHAIEKQLRGAQCDDDIESACTTFLLSVDDQLQTVGVTIALFVKALLISDRPTAKDAIFAFAQCAQKPMEPSLRWMNDAMNVLRVARDADAMSNLVQNMSSHTAARFLPHAIVWMRRLYDVHGAIDCGVAWRLSGFCRALLLRTGNHCHYRSDARREVAFYTGVMLVDIAEKSGNDAWISDALTHFDACASWSSATSMRDRTEFLRIRRHAVDAHSRVEALAKRCRSLLDQADAYAWLIDLPTTDDDERPVSPHKRMEWFGRAMSLYDNIPDEFADLRCARQAVALHAAASLGLRSAADDDLSAPRLDGAVMHAEAVELARSVNTRHFKETHWMNERVSEYMWACQMVAESEYKAKSVPNDGSGADDIVDWSQMTDEEFSKQCQADVADTFD